MKSRKTIAIVPLLLSIYGCGENVGLPLAPPPAAPIPTPVATIRISADSALIIGGMIGQVSATVVDANGRPVFDKALSWSSSDKTIAEVRRTYSCGPIAIPGCDRALIYPVSEGTATIKATVDGVSATMRARVAMPPFAVAEGIEVDFKVVEISPMAYAPRMTVRETTGRRAIQVIAIAITIPGRRTVACIGTASIGSGLKQQMFPYVYGDFQLVMTTVSAVTADKAFATVYIRDSRGTLSREDVLGKIEPGTPPTVLHEDGASWQCQ